MVLHLSALAAIQKAGDVMPFISGRHIPDMLECKKDVLESLLVKDGATLYSVLVHAQQLVLSSAAASVELDPFQLLKSYFE